MHRRQSPLNNPVTSPESAYRSDIDGLRAIAVVAVVLYHAGLPQVPGGYVGVDVFFVISGYLITGILLRDIRAGRFSLLDFYERRARRILPALFFMLVLTAAGAWLLMLPPDLARFGQSVLAVLAFGANYFFSHALGDYFALEAEFHPLLHMWSLAVEEQFYLVFPLLLLVLLGRGERATLILLGGLAVLSLALAQWRVGTAPVAAFYHAPPRIWELMAGALLALRAGQGASGAPRMVREAGAALGLALILWSVFAYTRETPFPGLAALLPVLGTVLLIGAGEGNLTNRLIANRLSVFLGLISYSLYLMHWPVMAFLRIHTNHVSLSPRNMALALLVSLVAAVFSWWVVERPFRDRRRFGRGAIFGLSGAGAALAACFGLAVFGMRGVPERFPADVMLIAAGATDRNPRREECFDRWPEAGLCRIGVEKETADFLLWGDSHADALMPGVDAAARAAEKSGIVLMHGGCPPLLGVYNPDVSWGARCLALYDRLIGELEAQRDVRTVILAARWGAAYGLRRPDTGQRQRLADVEAPGQSAPTAALFETGLRRTLSALRAQGREIVILAPLPEVNWNVPQQLLRQARFGGALPPIPDAESHAVRHEDLMELFEALVAEYDARLVSLTDVLCTPQCLVVRDGHPLYVDDDHISTYSARELLADPMGRRFWSAED